MALKNNARHHYLAYRDLRPDLDCGVALASYIDPSIEMHRQEFNKIMDYLATIDPDTPTQRL
jgi:hypothetical protein